MRRLFIKGWSPKGRKKPTARKIALVLVGVALLGAACGSSEVTTQPPFETPEDAAIAYLDNVNGEGDYAAYGAMFTADALNAHLDIRGVMDDVKEQQRYESLAAEDALMELAECEPPEGSVVFCDVILSEGTLVSIQGGSIDFRVRLELSPEGLISRLNLFPVSGSQARELAFLSWMKANHPELQEEFYLQLWGEAPLVRPIEQVIAEFLVAEAKFVAENP